MLAGGSVGGGTDVADTPGGGAVNGGTVLAGDWASAIAGTAIAEESSATASTERAEGVRTDRPMAGDTLSSRPADVKAQR